MRLFKRKIRVKKEEFVGHQAEHAVVESSQNLRELFASSKVDIRSGLELSMFAAFLPLLAMSLADLDTDVQRGYVSLVAVHLDEKFSGSNMHRFQERVLQYLKAFDDDIAKGQAHLLPQTLTLALENIVGRSDESVVMGRIGLVKTVPAKIKINVEFFRDLKLK